MKKAPSIRPRQAAAAPYLWAKSYQTEDRAFFHGRERDATAVLSLILGSRFSLLHAPSAAGKTSLLNARTIPSLESRGWRATRIRIGFDPLVSVRRSIRDDLLPPPSIEAFAIAEVIAANPSLASQSLADCLRWYDALPESEPLKRGLITFFEWGVDDSEGVGDGYEETVYDSRSAAVPFFARLLRGTLSMTGFKEHLAALAAYEPHAQALVSDVCENIHLADLSELLNSGALADSHAHWMEALDIPTVGFVDYLRNLLSLWGSHHNRLSLVLIFDQFEEIFTRFVDAGQVNRTLQTDTPDWKLKRELFNELEALYQRSAGAADDENDHGVRLPIRFVISMRDEFIAQLEPIRSFVENLDDHTYRLDFLDKNEAEAVIREPAKAYDYDYSNDCFSQIVRDLTREERFVEPAHVQIVCTKLWDSIGRDMVAEKSPKGEVVRPTIRLEQFMALGGTDKILSSYFDEFLATFSATDRAEVLDMMDLLITPRGTRNIAGIHELSEVIFRDPAHRLALLYTLVDHNIVRLQGKMDDQFAEITHEFLISPIRGAMRKQMVEDIEESRFRELLRKVQRVTKSNFRTGTGSQISITPEDFELLHTRRDTLVWTAEAIELMFRAIITHGGEREVMEEWIQRLDQAAQPLTAQELEDQAYQTTQRGEYLDMVELRLLRDALGPSKHPATLLEFLACSALRNATPQSSLEIHYWFTKFIEGTET